MFYLLAALMLFACGGEAECTYNGKTFRVSETFPASDGCNTCKCEGADVFVCTEKKCAGKGKAKGKAKAKGKSKGKAKAKGKAKGKGKKKN
jgi:hypothetical protein